MKRPLRLSLVGAALAVSVLAQCRAGEMKAVLDCGVNLKLLKSHFGRYPSDNKAIQVEPQGLRCYLSTSTKKPEQTGLYSFFAVAGDFEISATYEWTPVLVPKDGYGVSCGIGIDTDTRTVHLARGNFPGNGSGYVVTRTEMVAGKKVYKNDEPIKTQAKTGRLVLRRERTELICLTADGAADLTEQCRIPFTAETVRKVRFFADPGNAPTNLDARLTKIHLRAEEITTNIPLSEASGWGWWLTGAALVLVAAAAAWLVYRIRTGRWWTG